MINEDFKYIIQNTTTKEAYYLLAEELIELSKVMLKAARVGTPGNEHLKMEDVQADFDEEIADVSNALDVARQVCNTDQDLNMRNAWIAVSLQKLADQKITRWANRIRKSKEESK